MAEGLHPCFVLHWFIWYEPDSCVTVEITGTQTFENWYSVEFKGRSARLVTIPCVWREWCSRIVALSAVTPYGAPACCVQMMFYSKMKLSTVARRIMRDNVASLYVALLPPVMWMNRKSLASSPPAHSMSHNSDDHWRFAHIYRASFLRVLSLRTCIQYLYTLCVTDKEKADKLTQSLPPGLRKQNIDEWPARRQKHLTGVIATPGLQDWKSRKPFWWVYWW